MGQRATFHYRHPLPIDPAFPGGPAVTLYIDDAIRRGIEKFEHKNGSIDYDGMFITLSFTAKEILVTINGER